MHGDGIVESPLPSLQAARYVCKLPPVLRCSNRQEMTKDKSKKSGPRSEYRRTSTGNSTTPKMTKDTATFIEKLAEKDSK